MYWFDNFNKTSAREVFKMNSNTHNSIACVGLGYTKTLLSYNNNSSFNYYNYNEVFSNSNLQQLLQNCSNFVNNFSYIACSITHAEQCYRIPLHPNAFKDNYPYLPITLLDFNPGKNIDCGKLFKYMHSQRQNQNTLQIGKADIIFFLKFVRVCVKMFISNIAVPI